jgi:hypothetical protein
LHAALLAEPRRAVSADQTAAIADSDARENWQVMLAFRDHLTGHRTIEAAYLDIIRRGIKVPHLFINQLVHVILRNALDDCDDPYVLRAAELLFRPQRMTLHDGSLIAADEETISGKSNTPVSPLVSMLGIPAEAEIDVMNDDNAEHYFEHSDQFHAALDLTGGRRGLQALSSVIARWVEHLLGRRRRGRAAHRNARSEIELVRRPRQRRHQDRRRAVERRGARRSEASPRGRAVPADVSQPRRRDGQGEGRAGLSDPGDGQGQGAALKPQNLITGLPIKHLEAVT